MATKASEKTSLEIKRLINAPRNRVYAAWTDPAQLKEWWGPEGVRTRNFSADARVGGKYRWDLFNQEGEEMTVYGEYRELVPGKRIVFTWQWDDDEAWKNVSSVVTVELADRNGGNPPPRSDRGAAGELEPDAMVADVTRVDFGVSILADRSTLSVRQICWGGFRDIQEPPPLFWRRTGYPPRRRAVGNARELAADTCKHQPASSASGPTSACGSCAS